MKAKRWISLWLLVLLLFSMMDASMLKVDAANNDTLYAIKHLQNGNFEENQNNYTFSSNNYVQPNKTSVPYWDTTALGGKFEFFKKDSPHFITSGTDYRNVAEGKVAAELNADEVSTIYQRVKTVAGSTYTWGLYHRGRKGTDRMVLFIGPEQKDANGNRVDPSKDPNVPEAEKKNSPDQFVRITNWLKGQYGVDYPKTGCSKKYIVYSKPFAADGKFKGENGNDISLVKTSEINQEWSVWVISSLSCNTDEGKNVNGWSKYGTNDCNNFEDIMKGENSSLRYDCTYTVPNGQTETLFAFCSYESSDGSKADPTFGNLLDDINFDLYQPFSTSTTPGGQGNVDISVSSNITSGNPLYTTVQDGQYCTISTSADTNGSITGCTFKGAYVTINNDNGTTSTTKFVPIYTGTVNDENRESLLKQYFLVDPNNPTQYYYKVSVGSPVSIHLIYEKAPFVLYDANGGADYRFSSDNTAGGNLVGFGDYFQTVSGLDTSEYYTNFNSDPPGQAGFYKSHDALPNASWDKNDDDPDINDNPYRFCGWKILDTKVLDTGIPIVLDGEHRIEYMPTGADINTGIITITDSNNTTVNNLQLDASNGVTLSAIWKFANRAYAQTLNNNGVYDNSAVGGTVEETMISNNLRSTDVIESYENVSGVNRVSKVYAFGSAGDTIMFKATANDANNYKFVGWYKREKQGDTYTEVLKSTATSIAVTVEEGKLGTYYARFQKMDNPVVFHYSASGSADGYDYYDKSTENPYGKYFQDVVYGAKAEKPTGDTKSVQTWFTSPTKRSAEYIFDFNTTPITQETHLYAGPTFTYNYFNNFSLSEPWTIRTYATLKFDGKYIDLKNNSDVSDYNVYILKGRLGETAPSAATIKSDAKTIKVGMNASSENLLTNTVTNTQKHFNRIGTSYTDLHIFDMKTPVWVVFDFTYKGVTYTSTVKDRSLYNNIEVYAKTTNDEFFTTLPPDTQSELRNAQIELLKKIQGLYDAGAGSGITTPSKYAKSSAVIGLSYDPTTDNKYTFKSTTAIRNIEPWGLKYSFTVADQTVTNFADYGAVVLTDRTGSLQKDESTQKISVDQLLENKNSVMYSKSKNNVYAGENGAVEVYYVNDLHASDFDKNTFVVFFVKDTNGKYYFSDVVQNTYNSLAGSDKSEISTSIVAYSNALTTYLDLLKQAGTGQSTSPVA